MPGYPGLTAFATLLCGVSALVPSSPGTARWPRCASRVATPIVARFAVVEPATKPSFMLHSRVAEPTDVASVPAAAGLLSTKFPEDPFVLQHRSDTGYLAAQEGAPVLDLSDLKEITIADDGGSIKCDAGITVAKLVSTLSNLEPGQQLGELFTVLPSDSKLPVVEAVIDAALDPESRGREYAQLSKAVEALHVVGKDGAITSKSLSDFNADTDIVVSVILAAPTPSVQKPVLARWYSRLPTAPPITERVLDGLSDATHVMIFKYGAYTQSPSVVIFVDGDAELDLPQDEWRVTVARTPEEFWHRRNDLFESARFDVLTASAVLEIPADQAAPSIAEVLEVFPARGEHLLVQINKRSVVAKFDARYPPDVDEATRKLFTEQKTGSKKIATAGRPKARKSGWTSPITASTVIGETEVKIEGFSGEIYDGSPGFALGSKRQQYATTSYDSQMNPSIIAYPKTENDVVLAIKYATSKDPEARKTSAWPSGYPLKVMGRGGGHQYCGTSCDNDALILSMDYFNTLEMREVNKDVMGPDGKRHTVTKEFHVGTGILLKDLATFFNSFKNSANPYGKPAMGSNEFLGVTVPHGECPTVGIGGHAQSGGVGHIVRNFGYCVDYVYGFTIVTANGSIRKVNRDSPAQEDKELYWAVLGGSPGAFGVTTHLVFHPILDEDYPDSTGWDANIPYTAERMKACLVILEDFVNRAQETDDNALPEGLDLMMSMSSALSYRDIIPLPPMILFELECKDMKDTKAYGQMQEIIEKFKTTVYSGKEGILDLTASIGKQFDGKSHYKLSQMSLGYTRKPPMVTRGGRENPRAYNKAAYGSKDKVTPGWSTAYAKLLDEVVDDVEHVHCVFQVVVGGGAQTRNGEANLNAMSHRDAHIHTIVFDLFRDDDNDSIKAAADFQKSFEMKVVNKHQTAHPKVMAQWASHGDLDMDKQQVWEKYIDNDKYDKLRRIKKDVDPDDVFHARFTIRPEP